MMREDTTVASCATPPPQRPVWPELLPSELRYWPVAARPAASEATIVPWPTLSSTLTSLVSGLTLTKFRLTRPVSVGWLRFTPESTKPIVTPAPRRPAPSAPAALVRTRCSLRLGSATLTGAPLPGTAGGFTWVSEVSVGTVVVKSGPVPPGTTGGGGVARTLPPPPHAARPRAMAQARAESAQGLEGRSGLDMVRTPARHPPPRNCCAPLAHYANSSAPAAGAIIAACGQGRHKPNGVSMSDVVIVGARRTAIGSLLGQFTGVPTPTLGSTAIRGALEHAGLAA